MSSLSSSRKWTSKLPDTYVSGDAGQEIGVSMNQVMLIVVHISIRTVILMDCACVFLSSSLGLLRAMAIAVRAATPASDSTHKLCVLTLCVPEPLSFRV